jgi:hypothetical protein
MRRILHAGFVLGGLALAAWLASVAAESLRQPDAGGPSERAAPPAEPLLFDLQTEAARLRARLDAAPAPLPRGRNPFRFERLARPTTTLREASRFRDGSAPSPLAAPAPASPSSAAMSLRFIGVAEQLTDAGLQRVAILSTGQELFHATPGDLVAGRYRVRAIGADAVELLDEAAENRPHRLALR